LADASVNWENIENGYTTHSVNASANLKGIKESEALKIEIDESTLQFEAYKMEVLAEREHQAMIDLKNNLRTSLLGKNYTNDDMKFVWINKNNILSVYQNFVDTVVVNKEKYSREDWDEIKLL
jgi:hypothetical protein